MTEHQQFCLKVKNTVAKKFQEQYPEIFEITTGLNPIRTSYAAGYTSYIDYLNKLSGYKPLSNWRNRVLETYNSSYILEREKLLKDLEDTKDILKFLFLNYHG